MKNTNNIIFTDNLNIEGLEIMLSNICEVLNQNHKKVLAFNPNLSYNITLNQSFYNKDNQDDSRDIIEETYNELNNLIKSQSPFYTEEMIIDYYNKLKETLHYNDYRRVGDIYVKEDNNEELESRNIKVINRSVGWRYNLGSYDKLELAKRYIRFKDNRFEIIPEKLDSFKDSKTYRTQNKKQQKALDLLSDIDKLFKELNEINPDLANKNLLTDDCEVIPDKNLVKYIYEIK